MAGVTIERAAAKLGWFISVMIAISLIIYLFAQLRVEMGWGFMATHGAATAAPLAVRVTRHVSAILALLALWQLWRMVRLVRSGDRFSRRVSRHLRRFALILFASATLAFSASLLPMVLPHAPQSPPFVNLRELWLMMATGALFLVARLLDDAARAQAELAEMV